ncbi:DUF3696 domain-containing protein [Streptomyces sp. NPDC005529]|uniref:DUF3696 domain-containing protein n=1 Tax=unclassified Streptomyces TaxID=2593676 RepID=UPI0033AD4E02
MLGRGLGHELSGHHGEEHRRGHGQLLRDRRVHGLRPAFARHRKHLLRRCERRGEHVQDRPPGTSGRGPGAGRPPRQGEARGCRGKDPVTSSVNVPGQGRGSLRGAGPGTRRYPLRVLPGHRTPGLLDQRPRKLLVRRPQLATTAHHGDAGTTHPHGSHTRKTSEVVSPVIGADGRLSEWPEGFFDEWENSLDQLLD